MASPAEPYASLACRICGHGGGNRAYSVREMMFGLREAFPYVECRACGCIQLAKVPRDLDAYYPASYGAYTYVERLKGLRGLARLGMRWRDRYAVLDRGVVGRLLYSLYPDVPLRSLQRLGLTGRARILDVGCGGGHLIWVLRELGFKDVLGVDLYIPDSIRHANGAEVRKQRLEDTAGGWDAIMFHHSPEHMHDPEQALRAAAERLARHGVCVVRVPVVPNAALARYGANWVQFDAPRHLFLHSATSIGLLAERAGLRVEAIVHDSNEFQFWGSEQYQRDIPLHDPRSYAVSKRGSMFKRSDIRRFRRQSAAMNRMGTGDEAAFYLRK